MSTNLYKLLTYTSLYTKITRASLTLSLTELTCAGGKIRTIRVYSGHSDGPLSGREPKFSIKVTSHRGQSITF